jgi:hypothetical protein
MAGDWYSLLNDTVS